MKRIFIGGVVCMPNVEARHCLPTARSDFRDKVEAFIQIFNPGGAGS